MTHEPHTNSGAPPAPDNTIHAELVRESHRIARMVLPFLGERQIPVTPINYRLWYEYFSGNFPELKITLDQLLESNALFTEEFCRDLYMRFFSLEATEDQTRLVNATTDRVQNLAVQIIKDLIGSIARTHKYGTELKEHLHHLEITEDVESIQDVVRMILDQTVDAIRGQDDFQRRMAETRQELIELQAELRQREKQALTDELTKLLNRRGFNRKLGEEMEHSRLSPHPAAVIMLDLDDFKLVNDTFGHVVGDRLLMITADAIRRTIRGADQASRYGGEEFAIICPETDLAGAARLAERLRVAIDRTVFTVRGQPVKVGISAGVSLLRTDDTAETWIDRADRSLYEAKRNGKNRVCTEKDLPQESER